jgi:hypothetical protein
MKDEVTGCELGDILSFPPHSRTFRVVAINPLTIESTQPETIPLRFKIVTSPTSEPFLAKPK